MKVLVIGSGGREHALVRALSREPHITHVAAAPGNPGMISGVRNPAAAPAAVSLHPVVADDGASVTALAQKLSVDLVVIGPEAPLVAGVADALRSAGVAVFGPSAEAAQLEGSKAFAKDVMAAAGVPTAAARVCETSDAAAAALDEFGAPHVVKDDGLAGGKGVIVTDDRDEALAHAEACGRVVIEEFLDGPEVSLFAITDGETVYPLQPAQDFKRIGDGDAGPNTGGMGAYTPLDWAPDDLVESIQRDVLEPTIAEMARRGAPFSGLLYTGLAMTSVGPRVVEFNARFGDPETQPLLEMLASPLSELLMGAATGTLADVKPPEWQPGAAVAVVMASAGYPERSSKGQAITGLEAVDAIPGAHVIHAGTAVEVTSDKAQIVTAGGRVLAVVGRGQDLESARLAAYRGVDQIEFEGAQFRTDIAEKAAGGNP